MKMGRAGRLYVRIKKYDDAVSDDADDNDDIKVESGSEWVGNACLKEGLS